MVSLSAQMGFWELGLSWGCTAPHGKQWSWHVGTNRDTKWHEQKICQMECLGMQAAETWAWSGFHFLTCLETQEKVWACHYQGLLQNILISFFHVSEVPTTVWRQDIPSARRDSPWLHDSSVEEKPFMEASRNWVTILREPIPVEYSRVHNFFPFWFRLLISSPGSLWTHDHPSLASQVLDLKVCAIPG